MPTDLYEAAQVDDAGPARRFWMISPALFFNLLLETESLVVRRERTE